MGLAALPLPPPLLPLPGHEARLLDQVPECGGRLGQQGGYGIILGYLATVQQEDLAGGVGRGRGQGLARRGGREERGRRWLAGGESWCDMRQEPGVGVGGAGGQMHVV